MLDLLLMEDLQVLYRPFLLLLLVLLLSACAGDRGQAGGDAASAVPPATVEIAALPTAGTRAPSLPTIASTPTPTPAPLLSRSTATIAPAAQPSPTATAIPAIVVTPRAQQAPLAQSAPVAHQYVFPVRSKGKISYGRYHHDYPAADIFCPVGSEFVAVTDGVVDWVSRDDIWTPAIDDGATRGGLSVAIIGDDGVRYYGSHLSQVADAIEPGVRVKAGQLLGLTGRSGDARYTNAHLHFGISHPTKPADWKVRRGEIWPYDYLKAWEHGENVTPKLP
jgi:murein DD-endopeptidase MepM/ murein hydrolase activator NlpD